MGVVDIDEHEWVGIGQDRGCDDQPGRQRRHDLLHTYASRVIQDSGTIEQLSELLGHSSIVVTQRYTHLARAHWDGVRSILSARVAPLLRHHDLEVVETTTAPASIAAGQEP